MMLEELQRRNYAQSTVEAYTSALRDFAKYFHKPPDQLGPEHIRQYQLHLLRDQKLAANTVKQRMAAVQFFFVRTLKRMCGKISLIRKLRGVCRLFLARKRSRN